MVRGITSGPEIYSFNYKLINKLIKDFINYRLIKDFLAGDRAVVDFV